MSAQGVHIVTQMFEQELCRYTGAPYAVATDNMSNGLFLCLKYERENGNYPAPFNVLKMPSNTYPSVPSEAIMAGWHVDFIPSTGPTLTGAYQLWPTRTWDSALRFTADMYRTGQFQCVSFTGQFKHLKLGKGGAILLDDPKAYEWFKKSRNSGRSECSYHEDNFTMIGRNCYMHPTVAALGLQLITQFYNLDGTKKHNEDLTLPYPDLSKFRIYTQ